MNNELATTEYLLLPGTILGCQDTAGNKKKKNLCPDPLVGEAGTHQAGALLWNGTWDRKEEFFQLG